MLHRLRGLGMTARVIEAGDDVGGTWYWNRYPGARCDIQSLEYSYSFDKALEQEWEWSERFASQPEILDYARHVAERFDLRRDITFSTRVERARFDDDGNLWHVDAQGLALDARFLILATGCLSSPNRPTMEGLDSFGGRVFHTGEWPHEKIDFTGRRVGVIGTGSSAVQSIPVIAEEAARLTVFQRTPNFIVPARNRPLGEDEQAEMKAHYAEIRARARMRRNYIDFPFDPRSALEVDDAEREQVYEDRWQLGGLSFNNCFADQLTNPRSNELAGNFIRRKIAQAVKDPQVAERLTPASVIGCKRLCVDTGYYETFNLPHVELVDISQAPIGRITEGGLVAGGRTFELDDIVFATGFDAMTGSLDRIRIEGTGGRTLKQKWSEGPVSYLGLMVEGFPNLFTITGPGSPSVLSNMLASIEQHVEWVSDCLAALASDGRTRIEAEADAEAQWVEHVREVAGRTLYPTCNSWYLGANIPGKPRVFMPYVGCPPYREICDRVAAEGYRGFRIC
ncbi:MAG: NAD(P)/FAD-dependent oxidoreductase [Geminicoccaceae bacterium]|nr:NAD(P)/FAD-dependent oxidoreductase [Geminicoccaceae bacterium]